MKCQRRELIVGHSRIMRFQRSERRRSRPQPRSPLDAGHIDQFRRDGIAGWRTGERRPVGPRLDLRPQGALVKQISQGRRIADLAAAEPSAGIAVQVDKRGKFLPCPVGRPFQDRDQHEPRAHGGRIERRIGISGPGVVVTGRRLYRQDSFPAPTRGGKIALLQADLAQGHQGLIAPGTGEGLLHNTVEQFCVAAGNAFFVPFLRDGIDAAAVELQGLRRQRGQFQLAGIAQIDIAQLGDGKQLAFGILHHLPQGFNGLVPLVFLQALLGPFQMGQGGAVGTIELHGLRKLELAARRAEWLCVGCRRNDSAQHDQHGQASCSQVSRAEMHFGSNASIGGTCPECLRTRIRFAAEQ